LPSTLLGSFPLLLLLLLLLPLPWCHSTPLRLWPRRMVPCSIATLRMSSRISQSSWPACLSLILWPCLTRLLGISRSRMTRPGSASDWNSRAQSLTKVWVFVPLFTLVDLYGWLWSCFFSHPSTLSLSLSLSCWCCRDVVLLSEGGTHVDIACHRVGAGRD